MSETYKPKNAKLYLVKPTTLKQEIYENLAGYGLLKEEFSIRQFHQLVMPTMAVIGHIIPHGPIYYLSEEHIFCTRSEEDVSRYIEYIESNKLEIVKEGNIQCGYLEATVDNIANIAKDKDGIKQLQNKIKQAKNAENRQIQELLALLPSTA